MFWAVVLDASVGGQLCRQGCCQASELFLELDISGEIKWLVFCRGRKIFEEFRRGAEEIHQDVKWTGGLELYGKS